MRHSFTAAVLALSLTAAGRVSGQDDPRKVQAAPIFDEGRRLAEKGQNADSLEKFKKAYAIYPSPNTLFNVARQEQLLGRRLESIRDFREALRNSVLLPAAADLARTYVAELERVLGRVKILGPEGTRVTVDGRDYTLPLAEPIDVEPGTIAIKGAHAGESFSTSAEVLAGGVVTASLGPKAAPTINDRSPPSEAITEPPAAESGEGSFWGWRSIGGLTLIGAGAVAIGVGIAAKSEQSSQQDKMTSLESSLPAGEPGSRCFGSAVQACSDYRDARSARDAAQARGNTWLPIGVGAAAVGAGFVASAALWPHRRTSTSASHRPRVVPITGRGEAGLLFVSDF